MNYPIVFCFLISFSSLKFSQVLGGYKVPGLKPEPGHIINVADAPVRIPIAAPEEVAHLPKFFDVRKHWPECYNITSHISSQGSCGSCWAFSAVDVISDRLCIASKGHIQKRISAYHLLTCCGLGYCADGLNDFGGCRGGDTYSAFSFYDKYGLVTEECMPYTSQVMYLGIDDFPPRWNVKCKSRCVDPPEPDWGPLMEPVIIWLKRFFGLSKALNYKKKLSKGTTFYRLPNDEATIRKEIYEHGPVVMQFDHADFFNKISWRSGEFYFCRKPNQTPTHGVRAIGWGENRHIGPYWLLANSFGKYWNHFGGVFKMARGRNLCNLEKFVVAGVPKVELND